jgi:UTP--glucose-1-phosphate uridylyltransferase
MVTAAVFPIAGLGARFLPITHSIPKEMLPIVDKPLIHYAVIEALAAGITDLIFVTNYKKQSIEQYFSRLISSGLDTGQEYQLLAKANFKFLRYPYTAGLGHSIKCAEAILGNQSFAVLLPDDYMHGNYTAELIQHHSKLDACVIGVESIAAEQARCYGVVTAYEEVNDLLQIKSIIEKPRGLALPAQVFGVIGRYVFTPDIFSYITSATRCYSV